MLKIWGRKTSSNTQKVMWTCAELGEAVERIDWGGKFGGLDDPAYRRLNPNGRIPTLQEGDAVIWESNTIMRYLCTTRGNTALYPTDPVARARVERWMDWQIAEMTPPMTALLFGYYRTAPEKRDQAALAEAKRRVVELWSAAEEQLDGQDYLAGDVFTLADIAVGMHAHRWYAYPIERPALPRLATYFARLQRRPGFHTHVGQIEIV